MKATRLIALLPLAALFALAGCKPGSHQPAAPFDPRAPIVDFDLQGFIDKKLAAGEKEIIVPPGRYRVTPREKTHLRLANLDGVKIDAHGVEMICTETTRAIDIDKCRNVTLSGLTIDYDPLPFTQGRITALAPDKSWIEFEIFGGFPENLVQRIEIFDGKTELLKTPTHYGWATFESLGNRRYRVAKGAKYVFRPEVDREESGDILVTSSETAPGGKSPHALMSSDCTNLVLEDITLFASNCFSYFEKYCDNTTYLRCSIRPCPPDLDVRERAHRRIRSGNADAFHSKHAVRGPQIIGCTAKFQGDDCVNICGEYYMVMACTGNRLRVLAPAEINIQAGDPVELTSYTGIRLPDAKVLAIAPDEAVRPEEIAFLKAQNMHPNIRATLSTEGTKAAAVTLDREVALPMGSVIASMNHTGNGFMVKGCDFGFNRSRGILIKASRGKVTGNKITSSKMAAVLVAPEWWWLESGSSNDVEISNNTIADCGQTSIRVIAEAGDRSAAPTGGHRNIAILDNNISNSPMPCIEVTSTDGLVIRNNRFPAVSEAGSPAGARATKLVNCARVLEENNR